MSTTNIVCKLMSLTLLAVSGSLMNGCAIQKLDKNQVNSIELVKTSQRVIRKNCKGHVESDRTEVTGKPEQWVTVDPENNYRPVGSSFFNKTTRTSSVITNYTMFLVQYGTRDIGMFVNKGLNEVDFKFYSCPDPQNTQCASQQYVVAESGVLKLDVTYREDFNPNILTVEATGCTP